MDADFFFVKTTADQRHVGGAPHVLVKDVWKKIEDSRGEFFVKKKSSNGITVPDVFWFFDNFEKHDFVRNHHEESGRLRLFMKGKALGQKSDQSKDNTSRTKSNDFYANFRNVKKQLVFVYFLRTRKNNEKIDFPCHSEGGAKSVVSSLCNRIRYCEYSNNREGSTSHLGHTKIG